MFVFRSITSGRWPRRPTTWRRCEVFRHVLDDSLKRLRDVVGEASFGEEAEAAAIMSHMDDLRQRLIMSSALIGGLTALSALMVSLLVYRAIMRPVSALGVERSVSAWAIYSIASSSTSRASSWRLPAVSTTWRRISITSSRC